MEIAQDTAELLLKIGAVTFRFNPPYTFTSGIKSPMYLDNRLVMSYPQIRKRIIDLYVKKIKKEIGISNTEWISATATAAIPHGALVADRLKIPLVFVRPTTKMHGKGNKMEGYLKKGKKVVIVEDHVSTAESILGNVSTIRELGGIVDYCIATTTYETQKSINTFKDLKIKLIALTTGRKIAEKALEKKYLNKKQHIEVENWFQDPINWGNK